jgi:hypothetical protein
MVAGSLSVHGERWEGALSGVLALAGHVQVGSPGACYFRPIDGDREETIVTGGPLTADRCKACTTVLIPHPRRMPG